MDDPDAPGGTFVHWVIYNMPAQTQNLPKGLPHDKTLADGSMKGHILAESALMGTYRR